MKFNKGFTYIKVILLFLMLFSFAFAFYIVPQEVYAREDGSIVTGVRDAGVEAFTSAFKAITGFSTKQFILNSIAWILYLVVWLAGVLMSLGGQILMWVIKDDNIGMNYMLVEQGWTLTRDISNMLFIIALLLISFSTIFGIQNYHAKTMLPKLILIALTINFSLYFVYIVAGAGDVVMRGMLKVEGETNPAGTLVAIQNMPEILNLGEGAASGSTTDASFEIILRLLIAVAIFGAMGIAFLVTAFLFLIRVVILMLLAVAAPLAFVASLLPKTQSYFNQWFEELIKYSFMGPILLFMLLLTLTLSIGFINNLGEIAQTEGTYSSLWRDLWDNIIGAVFIIACLYISIQVAQRSKIIGADIAFDLKNWATTGKWVGSKAIKTGKWTADRTINRRGGISNMINNTLGRISDTIARRVPTLGAPLQRLTSATKGVVRGGRREAIDAYKKEYGHLSPGELREVMRSASTAAEKTAIYEMLSDKNEIDDNVFNTLTPDIIRYGEVSSTDVGAKMFSRANDLGIGPLNTNTSSKNTLLDRIKRDKDMKVSDINMAHAEDANSGAIIAGGINDDELKSLLHNKQQGDSFNNSMANLSSAMAAAEAGGGNARTYLDTYEAQLTESLARDILDSGELNNLPRAQRQAQATARASTEAARRRSRAENLVVSRTGDLERLVDSNGNMNRLDEFLREMNISNLRSGRVNMLEIQNYADKLHGGTATPTQLADLYEHIAIRIGPQRINAFLGKLDPDTVEAFHDAISNFQASTHPVEQALYNEVIGR